MKRLYIVLASALLTLPIITLSRAPWKPPQHEQGLLRFSWRMSVSARENCRARTEQELQALPVHMRAPQVCTADSSSYVLLVRVADLPGDTIQLVRGGIRGDRPLFVLEQRPLSPGSYRVRADLQRRSASGIETLAAIDTTLTVETGSVRLITLDAGSRRLIAR